MLTPACHSTQLPAKGRSATPITAVAAALHLAVTLLAVHVAKLRALLTAYEVADVLA